MEGEPTAQEAPIEPTSTRTGSAKIVAKHPLAIRWFHWVNFPVLAIMMWSGLLIYWANDVYAIKLGGREWFKFSLPDKAQPSLAGFPNWFYSPEVHGLSIKASGENGHPLYSLDSRLAEGMAWHFFFFWFFAINGLAYVLYLLFSREWKLIFPDRHAFKESLLVVLHDLHLRKEAPPQKKYNGAQKIAYTSVILMGAVMLLTGVAIYKPVQASLFTRLLGGYAFAREIHFAVMVLLMLFFLVHVLQVIRAGWANFRGMLTGKDIVLAPVTADPQPAVAMEAAHEA